MAGGTAGESSSCGVSTNVRSSEAEATPVRVSAARSDPNAPHGVTMYGSGLDHCGRGAVAPPSSAGEMRTITIG